MGDKPSYRCYLAHCFNMLRIPRLIKCKQHGQVAYFRDTTKRGKWLTFYIIVSFIVIAVFLAPVLYFSLQYGAWYLDDLFLLIPLAYPLCAFALSASYRLFSFKRISEEEAGSMRVAHEKKTIFGRKGSLVANIVIWSCLFLFWFSQSYSAAYIRYSIDIAAHNQSNWPIVDASVDLAGDIGRMDYTIKGNMPDSSTVDARILVVNSPYDVSVMLNGVSLSPYIEGRPSRYHTLWDDVYFYQSYHYDIPASLFKSVNTLHVESGLAKGDWTIEITPQIK